MANALTVIVDDQRYGSLPGTVQGSSVYWFCRSGEVTFDDYCGMFLAKNLFRHVMFNGYDLFFNGLMVMVLMVFIFCLMVMIIL